MNKYLAFLKFEETTWGEMATKFRTPDLKENATIMNHITLREIDIIQSVIDELQPKKTVKTRNAK